MPFLSGKRQFATGISKFNILAFFLHIWKCNLFKKIRGWKWKQSIGSIKTYFYRFLYRKRERFWRSGKFSNCLRMDERKQQKLNSYSKVRVGTSLKMILAKRGHFSFQPSPSLSHTHTHSFWQTHTNSLSISLTHPDTHTHTHISLSHTHTRFLTNTHALSF